MYSSRKSGRASLSMGMLYISARRCRLMNADVRGKDEGVSGLAGLAGNKTGGGALFPWGELLVLQALMADLLAADDRCGYATCQPGGESRLKIGESVRRLALG